MAFNPGATKRQKEAARRDKQRKKDERREQRKREKEANPGAPLKVLKWLGQEDAPLLFRLRADLRQWLWGLQFLRECTPIRSVAPARLVKGSHLVVKRELPAGRGEAGACRFGGVQAERGHAQVRQLGVEQFAVPMQTLDAADARLVLLQPGLAEALGAARVRQRQRRPQRHAQRGGGADEERRVQVGLVAAQTGSAAVARTRTAAAAS